MRSTFRNLTMIIFGLIAQSCNINQDDKPHSEIKIESNIVGCWTLIRENGIGCIEWCFDPSGQFYGIDQEVNGSKTPIEHFGTYSLDSSYVSKMNFKYFCDAGSCKIKTGDSLTIRWQYLDSAIAIPALGSTQFAKSSNAVACRDHWNAIAKPKNWTLN